MNISVGKKPHLSLVRIIQMNLGFFGLQFSFGLEQGNMTPIYQYLGADPDTLPLLMLAGPVTGLIVQPIIGAMSDRTDSKWGRRTPYFIIGAMICSCGLFLMPLSNSLLMAVSLLWILDAGNNITMEPYRAYVADRLNEDQHQAGFLSQSAFTGLAQMLAFLTPSLLVWMGMDRDWVDDHNIPYTVRAAFMMGAVLSITTILFSIWRVPELPMSEELKKHIASQPKGVAATFIEIGAAIKDMPVAMRKLGLMSLFQWYAMWAYWIYVIPTIALSVFGTAVPNSDGYRSAHLTNGEMAAYYNGIAFVAAFAMVPISKRLGAGIVHSVCLILGGIAMITLPTVTEKWMLFIPAIGVGIAWGSIMGNPYIILAGSIPPERTGVYMGIFNMMIVIPMILFSLSGTYLYNNYLGKDPRNALMMAGVLLICAALSVLWVREGWRQSSTDSSSETI